MSNKHCYLIVPEEFAAANNGYTSGASVLVFLQTTDGRWVVSNNAVNEFPEIFNVAGLHVSDVEPVWLGPEDFPTPTGPSMPGL